MKTCFKCREEKPLSEFYRHPQTGDGYLGKCKTCTKSDTAAREVKLLSNPITAESEAARHREKSRKYREDGRVKDRGPEYYLARQRKMRAKDPIADRARAMVGRAVRNGTLLPKPCEQCGSVDSEAHHPDHTKPLEVVWLCPKHHSEADNELRRLRRNLRLATAH